MVVRIPQETRAAILADLRAGGATRSAIASKHGVGNSTVTELAKMAGLPVQPKRKLPPVEIGQVFGRLTAIGPRERTVHGIPAIWCLCSCPRQTRKLMEVKSLLATHKPSRSCGCIAHEKLLLTRPSPEWQAGFGRRMASNPKRIASVRSPERKEQQRAKWTTHGLARHPLYSTWRGMMNRCYRETTKNFDCYGGRGITVYEPWHEVRQFISWIEANLGPRPTSSTSAPQHRRSRFTLDRIDNDGNYEPGNVRWATWAEQVANRRPLRKRAAILSQADSTSSSGGK